MAKLLTPKERFLQNASAVSQHHNVTDSAAVQSSLDAAMLQLAERYAKDDGPTSSLHFYRLQGAHEFVRIWLNLGDQSKRTDDTDRNDQLLDPDKPLVRKPKTDSLT